MQNFSVNSTLKFNSKDYQLRTSSNGQTNSIVCSLFRGGDYITSKKIKYEKSSGDTLLHLIKKFHEQQREKYEKIFDLSEKVQKAGNSEIQNMLGIVFKKNNLHIEAMHEFGRAINQNPADSWAYYNLSQTLLILKKYDVALSSMERAIQINPDYADFYNCVGMIYHEMAACKKAIDNFDKATSLNPYYSEAYFNRGLTFVLNEIIREDYQLSNTYLDEVVKSFEQAVLMNPSYQTQEYFNGIEHIRNDNPRKAYETLNIAKEKGTQSNYQHDKYEYYLKLLFLEDENQFDTIWKYIKFLQGLLKKYPGHADIYNDLGLAYNMFRNYLNEKAISNFQAALAINPDFEKAKRNFKLFNYEKTGAELLLKAITSKQYENTKKIPPTQKS